MKVIFFYDKLPSKISVIYAVKTGPDTQQPIDTLVGIFRRRIESIGMVLQPCAATSAAMVFHSI
jgi:hypothetical protein